MKPCLSHKGNKSYRLKRNRLTTCIRSCYHKEFKVFSKVYINRHYLFLVNERMSTFFDIYPSIKIKYRLSGTHLLCKLCLCKYKVKYRKYLHIISKLIYAACCLIGERRKDLFYLLCFLYHKLAKLIVILNHYSRLYK